MIAQKTPVSLVLVWTGSMTSPVTAMMDTLEVTVLQVLKFQSLHLPTSVCYQYTMQMLSSHILIYTREDLGIQDSQVKISHEE